MTNGFRIRSLRKMTPLLGVMRRPGWTTKVWRPAVEERMDDFNTLTLTERLLLMAAAVHGLGPRTELGYANTARVVNQALRWRGLSAEEIRGGWRNRDCDPVHAEVYDALIRMTHQMQSVGPGRAPERAGPALFEGGGNWGVPGDPGRP